jgi:hypothetical protein
MYCQSSRNFPSLVPVFAVEEEDVNINSIRVSDILSSPLVTISSNSTPEKPLTCF